MNKLLVHKFFPAGARAILMLSDEAATMREEIAALKLAVMAMGAK